MWKLVASFGFLYPHLGQSNHHLFSLFFGLQPTYFFHFSDENRLRMLISLAAQVGIMVAFLLALVLEDVEDPVSGWRWVIAAQSLADGSELIYTWRSPNMEG